MSFTNFEIEALNKHNEYRARHGCPPLSLSRALNQHAQDWANKIAARDVMEHRPNNSHGENIYCKWGSGNFTVTSSEAVTSWYDEIKQHNYNNNNFNYSTGHFTQVVWKSTRELGIAQAKSRSGKVYVVANYSAAGNMQGSFIANVPRPIK